MPQVFKIGPYWVYFWANENMPLEPVHVHVAEGAPTENGTKIWITKAGKCLLCNNASKIPERVLRNIMRIIEALRWWRSGLPSLVRPATTADPHRDPHGETKQRR